ncbi:outer membrane protein assembly factor BamD [Altibacter sp. HG106]|uniref:outer membrane protein assembly factor BamD n=1 Tax=Altibacter sp. HG106 TaxID=3023937 RepID=UPI0023506CE0|nr:outer membrane protein assembly factor BamD [Altibacter sp. HG106]MDC7995588.1 outer membrane protein assembly factor BamD [Altibacter sp. HG106]
MRSLLFFLLVAVMFGSCSKYQSVLRSESPSEKYAFADSLYEIGKYKKALKLMEQIVPIYRGKPQAEPLMFQYANTFYQLEDYYLAGYQFDRFKTSYPQSDSAEVAAYKSAKSYYQLSPRFSLDQEETNTALEKLQEFVNTYPESPYRPEANELVVELRQKLEKKDIEVAEQMLELGDYLGSFRPAIESFENFISDHPGSIYREQAAFGKLKATYLFAINSLPSLVQERLEEAKNEYNSFTKYYQEGEYGEEANQILEAINEGLAAQQPTS